MNGRRGRGRAAAVFLCARPSFERNFNRARSAHQHVGDPASCKSLRVLLEREIERENTRLGRVAPTTTLSDFFLSSRASWRLDRSIIRKNFSLRSESVACIAFRSLNEKIDTILNRLKRFHELFFSKVSIERILSVMIFDLIDVI